MARVVIFETNPYAVEMYGDDLARAGLLDDCELHLVGRTVDIIKTVLQRVGPELVVTSWKGIGPHVVSAARRLTPPPKVWVATFYEPDVLRRQHPELRFVDEVFEKDPKLISERIRAFFAASTPGSP